MKIVDIRAMRGPNYWSIWRHKLIVMKLDLEELEDLPTNKIDGFREKLEKMFPTMYDHRCSEGVEGGFFHRVDEGTWMVMWWNILRWRYKALPAWTVVSVAHAQLVNMAYIMWCSLIWKRKWVFMLPKLP